MRVAVCGPSQPRFLSTVENIPLNCPGFPSTVMLASTASTSGGVQPVVTTISAPEATFLATSVTVPGSFDKVRQLDITITTQDRSVTLIVRAGSSTGGELGVGAFFTDAFQTQQTGNGTSDPVALSSKPTVSVVDGVSRCNSASGDLLQITALETDPFATTGGLVRQFQATVRLGCLQACLSFLQ